MLILGIETSCDETAVAVVEDGTRVLSNTIATSKTSFERLAGVIPEQAARAQVECMIPVLEQSLKDASVDLADIDAIAVTRGPGLLGSLLVGTTAARIIASAQQKPLIGVHHTLGHLTSTWLDTINPPEFPMLTLSASGGHTDLWYRSSHLHGTLLGRTRDDAAGEAFDKGASLLGLSYPGGPSIAKEGEGGNAQAYEFPRPLHDGATLDFSFSGLKTSLKYLLRDLGYEQNPSSIPSNIKRDIAASYQRSICLHLVDRIETALRQHVDIHEVHLVGGVSANRVLRTMIEELCSVSQKMFRAPTSMSYCTDNAAMIASAGYFLASKLGQDAYVNFETNASLPLVQTLTR
jgi:N6-L-threonylcarbamoyladenine synthase